MILWHLGLTTVIARYVFRDPAMDLRWLMLGALLPDIIDKPIASILFHDTFGTHRAFAHSLVFPVVLLVAVMLITSRSGRVRKPAIAVVIGVFIHLVLDAAWLTPEAFLWPFFGLQFPPVSGSDFPTLVASMVSNPLVWAGEALGLAYLVVLWHRHLRSDGAFRRFLSEGTVPMQRQEPSAVC